MFAMQTTNDPNDKYLPKTKKVFTKPDAATHAKRGVRKIESLILRFIDHFTIQKRTFVSHLWLWEVSYSFLQ